MYKLEKFYKPGFDRQRYWENKYAQEHIAGNSTDEFSRQGFWPLLKDQLAPGKKYLDAGCGIGGWILFLKEQGYEVEGIDMAARTIRALTEYDPELKVKVASITAIPYPDQFFDGLLSIGVLEYAEDQVPQALTEAWRVLKPGGFLFIEAPLANSLRRLLYIPLKKLEKIIRTAQGQQPTFSNYLFKRASLHQLLTDTGFTVEKIQPHELPDADSHYGLYIDFPWLRGSKPYQLNGFGRLVKAILNSLSPWVASTGMVAVARKK